MGTKISSSKPILSNWLLNKVLKSRLLEGNGGNVWWETYCGLPNPWVLQPHACVVGGPETALHRLGKGGLKGLNEKLADEL
ncbi:hypothetical protein ACD591_04910 [Rufibacter glacialis]|uniref:Uncharacterized protein n=1 Tax=Rufibacter glacialis TaxID=1259555 RepID=A0ABV4RBY3_9BACT|nr:hypothetical protein GCM10011405_19820 [Rufibacter glacialis]